MPADVWLGGVAEVTLALLAPVAGRAQAQRQLSREVGLSTAGADAAGG